MDIATEAKDILTAPFKQRLDILHLFMLTGIVLVSVMVWMMILYHIRIAAETI